jgi:hypothetical protein
VEVLKDVERLEEGDGEDLDEEERKEGGRVEGA